MTKPNFIFYLSGHVPCLEDELSAPFYPGPSQRVLAVAFFRFIIVVKIETLLRLARERRGEYLKWEQWRTHVTWVERSGYQSKLWVSGPRLCCVVLTRSWETLMDVYDFGAQASAESVGSVEDGMALRFTPSISQILPFDIDQILILHGCHDSFSFVLVKTPRS